MTDTTPSDSAPADSAPADSAPADSSPVDTDASSAAKDPSDWVTGDEAMTGPQKSYLGTLAREAGEQLPEDLTKAEASEHIDRLQSKTGRGA